MEATFVSLELGPMPVCITEDARLTHCWQMLGKFGLEVRGQSNPKIRRRVIGQVAGRMLVALSAPLKTAIDKIQDPEFESLPIKEQNSWVDVRDKLWDCYCKISEDPDVQNVLSAFTKGPRRPSHQPCINHALQAAEHQVNYLNDVRFHKNVGMGVCSATTAEHWQYLMDLWTLLKYYGELVPRNGALVPDKCQASIDTIV